MFLGCHVSNKTPDYLYGSINEALSYGANACMIYTGAPNNTKRKDLSALQIEKAHKAMQANHFDLERMIVHTPYIINLANTKKPELAQFGQDFLASELKRVAAIGAKVLVLHPGSHVQMGLDVGIQSIVTHLNVVLDADTSKVCIALETMAGKGSEIGSSLEELKQIYDGVRHKDRVGVCLDTCHLNDAGYDVSDIDGFLSKFDDLFGLDKIYCIHINDSKNPCASHSDRHANIGKGTIGYDTLHQWVWHPLLKDVTKILETPYIDGQPPYKEEIKLLKERI